MAGPDQHSTKQIRPRHFYKSNPSRVSWVDLSRDWYIACPKLSSPVGNTIARGLLFTWANLLLKNVGWEADYVAVRTLVDLTVCRTRSFSRPRFARELAYNVCVQATAGKATHRLNPSNLTQALFLILVLRIKLRLWKQKQTTSSIGDTSMLQTYIRHAMKYSAAKKITCHCIVYVIQSLNIFSKWLRKTGKVIVGSLSPKDFSGGMSPLP